MHKLFLLRSEEVKMDAIEAYKMFHIIEAVEDSLKLLFALPVTKKRKTCKRKLDETETRSFRSRTKPNATRS